MNCKKCSGKDVSYLDVKERKCKSCGKKYRGRFTNICYSCQLDNKCIKCGEKIE